MISFVVPAYNEEALLGATLAALHEAARACGERYEIIVVDDASTDRTAAIGRAGGARVVPVAVRQIAAARNAGAAAAAGDRLCFVDADTLVPPAVLRAALAELGRGAVGGGAQVRFDGRLPLWARLVRPLFGAWSHLGRMAPGAFLWCTRRAYEAAGGFDEGVYAGEEYYMSLRLRRQGRFVVLRQPVLSSGRRLRAYSLGEITRFFWRTLRAGRRGVSQRASVAEWYEARRPDPDAAR